MLQTYNPVTFLILAQKSIVCIMLLFFSQNIWPMLGIPTLPLIGGASIRYIVLKEVNNW